MNSQERKFISAILLMIIFLTSFDIFSDIKEGANWWHVSVELMVGVIATIAIFFLLKGNFSLKHSLEDEKEENQKLLIENKKFKEQSKSYVEGLSQTINQQLDEWSLSNSEKEIAFLIIKGLSLKEIAEIRGTSEKTVRTQSTSIYSKAGIANRAQLSAFFLEDLLLPSL